MDHWQPLSTVSSYLVVDLKPVNDNPPLTSDARSGPVARSVVRSALGNGLGRSVEKNVTPDGLTISPLIIMGIACSRPVIVDDQQ